MKKPVVRKATPLTSEVQGRFTPNFQNVYYHTEVLTIRAGGRECAYRPVAPSIAPLSGRHDQVAVAEINPEKRVAAARG